MASRCSGNWVNFQDFANTCGVKRPAIDYASTHGLEEAVKLVSWNGKRKKKLINVDHELCIAYLQKQKQKAAELDDNYDDIGLVPTENYSTKSTDSVNFHSQINEIDVEKINSMTLGQIINCFGTFEGFKRFVEVSKLLAETRIKETTYLEKRGKLIDRQLISNKVFGALESVNKRLLMEATKTITLRLYNACKSGETLQQGEEIVGKILSQQLKHIVSISKGRLGNKIED